jgi:hypothetical protein
VSNGLKENGEFKHTDEVVGCDDITLANGKRVYIDWQKADLVFGTLFNAYQANEYPYNQDWCIIPEDPRNMPESMPLGGKEHAMFLWNSCFHMRGWNESVTAMKKHANLYDIHPELYDAEQTANMDPLTVEAILLEHGPKVGAKVIAKAWVENSKRMFERYQGDPRMIFDGEVGYAEAFDRIHNDGKGGGFWGFQEKMVSMAMYYLMEAGLIAERSFPAPIDRHLGGVSIAHEILCFEGFDAEENLYTPEVMSVARHLFHEYAKQKNIDPRALARAVWLLSSYLCAEQPGNLTIEVNWKGNRQLGRAGQKAEFIPKPFDINDRQQRLEYYRRCGMCPVEQTCEHNVPGKIYIREARLFRRGSRPRFPAPIQAVMVEPKENLARSPKQQSQLAKESSDLSSEFGHVRLANKIGEIAISESNQIQLCEVEPHILGTEGCAKT